MPSRLSPRFSSLPESAACMPYSWQSIDAVKCPNQRGLAFYWDRMGGGGDQLPRFADFSPDARLIDPRRVLIVRVENRATRQYRVMHYGARLREASGVDGTGKYIDQIVPPPLRMRALTSYDRCIARRCPVYLISRTSDGAGRDVYYERLSLPFGGKGNEVEWIVTLLHLISPEGRFERDGLFGEKARAIQDIQKALIRPGFSRNRCGAKRQAAS